MIEKGVKGGASLPAGLAEPCNARGGGSGAGLAGKGVANRRRRLNGLGCIFLRAWEGATCLNGATRHQVKVGGGKGGGGEEALDFRARPPASHTPAAAFTLEQTHKRMAAALE